MFTPQGKILALPKDSTAVDFAYAVHTDIGDCCVAAKINGESAPLRTVLRSGDRVEIVTASHAKPNPAWLNYVVTGKARSHIRRFLKTMQYEESARLGERLLNQALSSLKVDPQTISRGTMGKTGARQRSQIEERLIGRHGLGQAPAGGDRAAAGHAGGVVSTARAGRPTSSPFSALKAWQCNLRNVAGQFRRIQLSASSRKIKDLSFTPMTVRLYQKTGVIRITGWT